MDSSATTNESDRLVSQSPLTHRARDDDLAIVSAGRAGIRLDAVELLVEMTRAYSAVAMYSFVSGCRSGYDSMTKAVATAEKRPA